MNLNRKLALKKHHPVTIIIGVLCFLNTIIFAATPKTISIGLESVYKDAKSIHIASENNLVVGYLEGDYFKEEGSLSTNSITIARDGEDCFFTGNVYPTLEAATEAAVSFGNGAVAAYAEIGTYYVYTKNYSEGLLTAPLSPNRMAVYNENNELVFVSDSSSTPLMLQGTESGCSFPLTQVGNLGTTRKYRGSIGVVSNASGGLTALSIVDLEEYLYGVVPSEMGASWPLEALKAQAVAARSIALVQYNRYLSKGYNLVDTTACQVYKGFSVENPSTNLAVDETKGEVIKYNDQVAEALYFSTSGGTTEDAKYVWGNDVPYLKSVVDSFETEPAQKPWVRTITLDEISNSLVKQGINIGDLQGVEITARTPSGRVQLLTFRGTSSSYEVKNETVRTFFSGTNEGSLKSRLFSFSSENFIGTLPLATPSTTGSTAVSIMSANDFVQKDINKISIMSAAGIEDMPENSVLQSAEATQTAGVKTNNDSNMPSEVALGDLVIYGQGYGHGLGMSQSGAKGMAKAGHNYQDILTYYYNGVTVER